MSKAVIGMLVDGNAMLIHWYVNAGRNFHLGS